MNKFHTHDIVELKPDFSSSNLVDWESAKVIQFYDQWDEVLLEIQTPKQFKGRRLIEYTSHIQHIKAN